jgi:P-type Cu+ transporter
MGMSRDESVIEGTAIDPVCGMSVAVDGAEHVARHEGAEHYFCSSRCHDKFLGDPDLYLSGAHLGGCP